MLEGHDYTAIKGDKNINTAHDTQYGWTILFQADKQGII